MVTPTSSIGLKPKLEIWILHLPATIGLMVKLPSKSVFPEPMIAPPALTVTPAKGTGSPVAGSVTVTFNAVCANNVVAPKSTNMTVIRKFLSIYIE